MTKKTLTHSVRGQRSSLERREQQKQHLRQAILNAALQIFEQTGFEDFSMRQVAEQIGYVPATLYLHFSDKDDLLYHIALEGFRSFDSTLQAAFYSETHALSRLHALGLAYIRFALQHPVHYRLMFMQRGEFLNRDCPPDYASVTDAWGVLQLAVSEGLQRGELAPGEVGVYTSLLWAHIHGLLSLHLATPYYAADQVEPLYRAQWEVILRSLVP